MKVVIGIVLRPNEDENKFSMNNNLRKAVIECGGIVLGIAPTNNKVTYNDSYSSIDDENSDMITLLKMCDGIIFQGGNDFYEYDRQVLEYCIKNDIPSLGICLGMQLMASYKEDCLEDVLDHYYPLDDYVHDVEIIKDSKLYSIVKTDIIRVNSRHKMSVKNSGIYKVCAKSFDGVIEAIEYDKNTFNMGVQWHVEDLLFDDKNKRIFEHFMYEVLKMKCEIE